MPVVCFQASINYTSLLTVFQDVLGADNVSATDAIREHHGSDESHFKLVCCNYTHV